MIQWKCPSCGCTDLKVSINAWFDLIQDPDEDNFETQLCPGYDHEFDADTETTCTQCFLADKLRGFMVPPSKVTKPPVHNWDGTIGWDHIPGPLYTGFNGSVTPKNGYPAYGFSGMCTGACNGFLCVRESSVIYCINIDQFTFLPPTRRQIYDAASALGYKASFVGVSKDKGVKMLQLFHRKTTSLIRATVVNPIVAAYPNHRRILEWANKLAGCTLTDGTKII